MPRRQFILAALASCALAQGSVAAEPPRSVISWLSDVLSSTPAEPGAEPGLAPDPSSAPVVPFEPGEIETSSLDDPVRNGVGLLSPEQTGLPADLWGRASALRVRSLIYESRPDGVPAARRLFREIMLAQTDAPVGSGPRNGVLLARVDALMAAGLLEDAGALLEVAGVTDAELFRRDFDIGLLTGTADARCERLRDSPALSPTLPARVFCLARLGDWSAAALTLNLGREMNTISEPQAALLARFLDPQMFEGVEDPEIPSPLTTLDFVLREAVALPRPQGALPLAFLLPDAGGDAPLRARIEARERLVREGVLPAQSLFEAYRSGTPAASGGVWDRAAAAQALDFAFATNDAAAIAEAVDRADALLSDIGLRHALGVAYARQLAAQPTGAYTAAVRQKIGSLLLLAGRGDAAAKWFPDNNDITSRYLATLAMGRSDFPTSRSISPLKAAAASGLVAAAPPSDMAARIAALVDEGAPGEALLRVLDLLGPGTEIGAGELATALYVLRKLGLEDRARQVAVETILLLPEA